MRSMRFHRTLPRSREADASATTKFQKNLSRRSTSSTKRMTPSPTYALIPSAIGPAFSTGKCDPAVSTHSTPDVIVTPAPRTCTEPILLLEGDHYRVSENGVARSLYQLVQQSKESFNHTFCSSSDRATAHSLALEEIYDIERSRKAFLVRTNANERSETNAIGVNHKHGRVIHLGDSVEELSLLLQEIAEESLPLTGVTSEDGAGTGSRTWDASIAMSMYFASHPELMAGNVVELGSGVGLGGILSFLFRSLSPSGMPFRSMTLTDYNDQVLHHCTENVSNFFKSRTSVPPINVAKLNWYDFLERRRSPLDHTQQYDTVIACDCAYLYPDIIALTSTMKGLLKRKKTSRVHIFGPSNRGGLHELVSKLREENYFDIREEYIDMVRYRLDAPPGDDSFESLDPFQTIMSSSFRKTSFNCYSKFDSSFLHVTCSIRFDCDTISSEKTSAWDID
eukprot:jgi/Psemu1/301158/fgenesh1_kg.26_\